MLLSTAYFPPLSWFALALRNSRPYSHSELSLCHSERSEESPFIASTLIEAHENYQKQTYRNRCYILAAAGPQMLQVPVVHQADMAITRVQVDYSTPWVLRTERALSTAYESSAYFEYYADDLFALLEAQPDTLWELNLSLIRWCLDRLHVSCRLEPTLAYESPVADDFRSVIHPKHPDTVLEDLGLNRPYYQVFRDKSGGFTPGLSLLDLLFNEGPDSLSWLIGP